MDPQESLPVEELDRKKLALEIDNEELAKKKASLEIAHLESPWWRRPIYLAFLVPLFLGILTFASGILSGFFDTKRKLFEEEKGRLAAEITTLVAQKKLAELDVDRIRREAFSLKEQVSGLEAILGRTASNLAKRPGDTDFVLAQLRSCQMDLRDFQAKMPKSGSRE